MVPSGRHGVAKGMEQLLMKLNPLMIRNRSGGEETLGNCDHSWDREGEEGRYRSFIISRDTRIWCYEKVVKQQI